MADARPIAGKYQLLRKIAQGGMAEVFLAKQTGLVGFEKLVVIKRILPHLVENEEFVRMFLDEARTAADLRHPNVVQIFEIGEDAGTYFIAMEFLHGQDLRRIMKRQAEAGGTVPLGHALQMIIDASNGLDYAHKKTDLSGRALNIIHRDISPQNIIVTYDGTSKIVDFGIAKAASQSTETRSGVLKGKYSYMSPEQASGSPIDQRTDQFALGIVLYELTTMSRLFKYANEIMTLHAIIECNIKPPADLVPGYPRPLSDIVMTALARDRERRFRDLRAMADALEEFLAEQRIVHSPSRLSGYMQEQFRDHIQKEQSLGMPVIEPDQSGSVDRPTSRSRRRSNPASVPSASPSGVDSLPAEELQSAGTQMTISQAGRLPARSGSSARQPAVPSLEDAAGFQGAATVPYTAAEAETLARVPGSAGRTPSPGAFFPPDAPATNRRGVLLGVAAAVAAAVVAGAAAFAILKPADNGRLAVHTVPDGARVLVDGQLHPQKTPTVISDLEVGRTYAIRVELPNHAPVLKNVKITSTEPVDLPLTLEKDRPSVVLRFRTTPPGAKVYLDGRPLEGVTPLELADVPLDKDGHVATFSLEGHLDATKPFQLKEAGGVQDISATLARMAAGQGMGRLVIKSTPAGATITVNGKPAGTTPLSNAVEVAEGRATVAARLSGFQAEERLVDVEAGAVREVDFQLEKDRPQQEMGLLTLDTHPPTTVYTDKGKQLGRTPLKKVKVNSGTLTLRMVNEDKGIEHWEKVKIDIGKETARSIPIPKGRLKVVVKPWAHVYVDGRKVGTTPFPAKQLYVGRHQVRLVNDELEKDEKEWIVVKPNEDAKVKRDW